MNNIKSHMALNRKISKAIHLLLIFSLMVMLISCATGKKALQKGNYADAVFKSIERLRSNPDSKKAIETLRIAYPLATQTLEAEINDLLNSNEQDKYIIVAEKYQLLNDMAKEIRRSPAARQIITAPKNYSSQLSAAKEKAAQEAYLTAIELLNKNDRYAAIDAFHLLEQTLEYIPGYKDATSLLKKALDMATIKVVIDPINVPARYKLDADFFADQMAAFLNEQQEFVAFFNPDEATRAGHIDQVLKMQFIDFNIGATSDKQKETEVSSKDSVKIGTVTIDGKKVDVYNIVKAKITTHNRQVSASGVLEVKVIDVTHKKTLTSRNFPGTYVWETNWASYNGDQRALTKEELNLCKKSPANPPGPQDLFYEFTRPIFNQAKNFLRRFYRQY